MDARRSILLGVALAVAVAALVLAVLPRAPRRPAAEAAPTPSARPVPSAPPRMVTADLYAMFTAPTRARSFDTPVTLTVQPSGDLVLPTGRLVASDAFIVDAMPFTLEVPAGPHPVSVVHAAFEDGDRRVAAALVRFADRDPVRWELALVPGQDPRVLGPDEIFGYAVDSGTGAFTSPEAVDRLKDEDDYATYGKALLAAIPGKTLTDPLTAAVEVDPASGANVVAFASGFGDGAYPSYAGFDSEGNVVVVVTDFGILDAPKD
jgi:uncharacterized protein DUF4241